MIWLASFPRSGNTFFRIILHEVYGIESSAFDTGGNRKPKEGYQNYPVVKTHLLPSQLVPNDPSIPAVYIVRDGRDALVSMAHHRKDIVEPHSDFYNNLKGAIIAPGGSHFGGWSKNVSHWLERASIVIKFEDLIEQPIECVEQLRTIMDLPEPKSEKLPNFNDLKNKAYLYGSGSQKRPEKFRTEKRNKFFRRGIIGAWKDEMPEDLLELFWEIHGDTMISLKYNDYIPQNKTFMNFNNCIYKIKAWLVYCTGIIFRGKFN